jgi:hypothetical protein
MVVYMTTKFRSHQSLPVSPCVQVGGRQAQVPEEEQMPDSDVDAGKSDSEPEDGAGGLEPDPGG